VNLQRAQLKILTAPEWRGQYRDLTGKGATPNEAARELAGGFALRKDFTGSLVRAAADAGDGQPKVFPFVFSNESVDRDWDSIRLAGWQLANYKQNPVVLWAHDSYSLPIGRTAKLRKEDGNLVGDLTFCPPDMNPMGGVVEAMLAGGWLNAGSVGFLPLELEPAQEEDRQKRYGLNFLKQELLEFSIVPVPANPTALLRAVAADEKSAALWLANAHAAGVNTEPWRKWAERVLHRALKGLAISDLTEACEEMRKAGRVVVAVVRSEAGDVLQVGGGPEAEVPAEGAQPITVDQLLGLSGEPATPAAAPAPAAASAAAPAPAPAPAAAGDPPAEPKAPELTFRRDADGSYVACVDGQAKIRVEDPDTVELDADGILVLRSAVALPAPSAARTRSAAGPAEAEIMAALSAATQQVLQTLRPAGA
jgi:HK97 family phage prohead protease